MYKCYPLLLSLVLFTACNGQVKTNVTKDSVTEQKTTNNGQPKIIKTQGTGVYANTRCGLQDKAGNLWFGTTGEGVYCYDGKLFTQFTEKEGLSNNTVYSILEDKAGTIWLGTAEGLSRYNGKTITNVPITIDKSSNSLSNITHNPSTKVEVWSMMQDKSGTLWLGTSEGVYCYNDNLFTRFLDRDSLINKEGLHLKMVDCILQDRNGDMWFCSGMPPGEEGICRYDGKSITSFKPDRNGWIRNIVEDKNGKLWFGTRHVGNWCYDGKTFSRYTEKTNLGTPLLVDKAGNIWFGGVEHHNGYGADGGMWRYDGKEFTNFTTKDGLGDYSVWSIMEDRSGNIWVGTRNNGLYRYDGKTFTCFSE